MVVCAVDDLMFSSKISSAAKAVGVALCFERTPEKVTSTVRDRQASLVIIDLNSRRLKPLEVVAALKHDPALAGIRIVGYVSHVDTATIDAARRAGTDQVLARSAFSERLPEILRSA
jgi:DNA-binding NarL/FixJ family response regulator